MNMLQESSTQISFNKNSKGYNATVIALLIVLLLIGVFLSISIGSTRISLSEIISAMQQGDITSKTYRIISYVRIPRTLAALLAGCALSVSGAILQSVLNNSLASPGIIGVNAGAGLLAVLIAAFFPAFLKYTTIAAFTGALMAVLLVYFIARRTGASRMAIVLSSQQ
jgi:iron complex transport system permease protein